jgi:hypothetical protein
MHRTDTLLVALARLPSREFDFRLVTDKRPDLRNGRYPVVVSRAGLRFHEQLLLLAPADRQKLLALVRHSPPRCISGRISAQRTAARGSRPGAYHRPGRTLGPDGAAGFAGEADGARA